MDTYDSRQCSVLKVPVPRGVWDKYNAAAFEFGRQFQGHTHRDRCGWIILASL